MACTLEVAANGDAINNAGLPTRLVVYGRITSGACTRVHVRVRIFSGAPVLFAADAQPDSNGTWSCEFLLIAAPLACGTPLWIEAQCAAGDTCSVAQTVYVQCKQPQPGGGGGNNQPQQPGGGNNGGNNNGGNNGNGDWIWPWPPAIFCPAIGRVFTQTLLLGVVALLAGVAMLNTVVVTGALVVIGATFAVFFGIWMYFCQPHSCYVIGAILWVMKRGTIVALILLLLSPHLAMLMALWIIGAIAGILTGRLRKLRCPIPSLRTSINQLPVW